MRVKFAVNQTAKFLQGLTQCVSRTGAGFTVALPYLGFQLGKYLSDFGLRRFAHRRICHRFSGLGSSLRLLAFGSQSLGPNRNRG